MSNIETTMASAKDRYEAMLANIGKLGTREGNVATAGFLDGVRFGSQVEAAASAAGLGNILEQIEEGKLSSDDVEQALKDLHAAILSGVSA